MEELNYSFSISIKGLVMIDSNYGSFVRFVYRPTSDSLIPLFLEMSFTTKGSKHTEKRMISFASVIATAMQDKDGVVYFSSYKTAFDAEDYPVSFNVVQRVWKEMQRLGWLTLCSGTVAMDGHAKRWQVSPDFLALVPEDVDFENLKPRRPMTRELVTVGFRNLNEKEKKLNLTLPPFDRNENTSLQASRLAALNELALQHGFEGLLTKKGLPREFNGFRRTFKHTTYWGGRIFGGCEQMHKEDRLKLKIDDQPVVELDISASQPTLLFAAVAHNLNLQQIDGVHSHEPLQARDYYSNVKCLSRADVKKIVMRAIGNAGLPRIGWTHGFKKFYPKTKWSDVRAQFIAAMPFLDHLQPMKYDALTLQYFESEIMMQTLEQLFLQGIPALPVHDSIVVPRGHQEQARRVFASVFEWKTGVVPILKVSSN